MKLWEELCTNNVKEKLCSHTEGMVQMKESLHHKKAALNTLNIKYSQLNQ